MGRARSYRNRTDWAWMRVNGEIYVPQYGKLLVYPREANGNVSPSRILERMGVWAERWPSMPFETLL